jgi:hypothetical protein
MNSDFRGRCLTLSKGFLWWRTRRIRRTNRSILLNQVKTSNNRCLSMRSKKDRRADWTSLSPPQLRSLVRDSRMASNSRSRRIWRQAHSRKNYREPHYLRLILTWAGTFMIRIDSHPRTFCRQRDPLGITSEETSTTIVHQTWTQYLLSWMLTLTPLHLKIVSKGRLPKTTW